MVMSSKNESCYCETYSHRRNYISWNDISQISRVPQCFSRQQNGRAAQFHWKAISHFRSSETSEHVSMYIPVSSQQTATTRLRIVRQQQEIRKRKSTSLSATHNEILSCYIPHLINNEYKTRPSSTPQ